MGLIDRLRAWLFPDPADALKGAENEALVELAQFAKSLAVATLLEARQQLPTPQHPNNQPLADPLGSEDAASVPDDLHDV